MHTFGLVQSQITNDRETFERRNILNLLKYFLLNFLWTWIPCCRGCPVCNGTAPRSKCKMGLLYLLLLEVLGGRKVNRNLKPGRCQSTRGFHPGHCSLPHLHHLHRHHLLHHHHLLYHLLHLLTWCKITTGRDAQCWTINGTNTIIRIEICSISPPHTIDSVISVCSPCIEIGENILGWWEDESLASLGWVSDNLCPATACWLEGILGWPGGKLGRWQRDTLGGRGGGTSDENLCSAAGNLDLWWNFDFTQICLDWGHTAQYIWFIYHLSVVQTILFLELGDFDAVKVAAIGVLTSVKPVFIIIIIVKREEKNKDFHQVCWRQARVNVRRFLCLHSVQVVPGEWKQIKLWWNET